jgi:hypothetical protein
MPLFDFYIMVDWSGAARRRGMRTDSIWIAFGNVKDETPETVSPFSRSEVSISCANYFALNALN